MTTRPETHSLLKPIALCVILSAAIGSASAATPLFSDNFDIADGLGSTLAARGWTDHSGQWDPNIVKYLDRDAAAIGTIPENRSKAAMNGPTHLVPDITFGNGQSYLLSAQVATESTIYGGNRFLVGLTQGGGTVFNGIYASVEAVNNAPTINIRIGNPRTLSADPIVSTGALSSWSAGTYYTITLALTAETVVASVFDGSNLVGSASYAFTTALEGTPFTMVQLGSRNGQVEGSAPNQRYPMVYFSDVSVVAVPEPSATHVIGAGLLVLVVGQIIRRRSNKQTR